MFATTPAGRRFFDLYDTLRGQFPEDSTDADLSSRYGTTRVTSWGNPHRPTLVFLPGAGASLTSWSTVAAALGADHRCHAVDVIGDIGRSVRGGGDPIASVPDLLEWLDTTLGSLPAPTGDRRPVPADNAPPTLVGHSYGAMVALAFAVARPHRVNGLILLDPSSCFGGMRPRYLWHALPTLLFANESRQHRFLDWETAGTVLDPPWRQLSAMGAAHFPRVRPPIPRRPKPAALAGLTIPVSVLLAAHSRLHNPAKIAESARKSLPQCSIEFIAGATHHSLPRQPRAAVIAALTAACAPPAND